MFATGILIAHAIAGTEAKVSLGSFPPFQVVVIGIIAMLLGALGGRISRALRERADPSLVKAREDLAN